MLSVAVLVSGGGTNLQALIDAQKNGQLTGGEIKLVLSNRVNAYALVRAQREGIETAVALKKNFADNDAYNQALIQVLQEHHIDLVVLAGFMVILNEHFISVFRDRIINVHPSLIPSFCGNGYYGLHVHQKALEYGVKVTGATVHFVNEVTDGGAIILQKAVEVQPGDTPETLQKRVMENAEWLLLPKAVSLFCQNKLQISGRTVKILP